MDLTFEKFSLANGLTVIVKENHHAQSVVVRGYLHGGANWEKAEQAGLASFTASAMRRGTTKRTFAEINEAVESVAASVYVHAGRHTVGFGGKSLGEDFELLIELMTDNLLYPTFPATEVEKLRGQIITDLKEEEDDPRLLAKRHFDELLYGADHPYGRPVDGTLASIAGLSRADLLAFYGRLHPHDGAVVVVGDVTAAQVHRALAATLGQWSPTQPPPVNVLPEPTPLAAAVQKVYSMPNKSQVDLVLGNVGPSRLAQEFYAADVGDTILGQLGLGGRIGQSVRDTAGMAYYARSQLHGGLGPGPWFIYAGVNPAAVDQAIDLIRAEIRRFRREPVSDQELADAKAYMTGVLPLQMESNEGVAAFIMEAHLYQLGDDYIARYPDIIRAVTKDEILAAAQKYLSDDIFALSIAGPYQQDSSRA